MAEARVPAGRALWVYILVCIAVYAATRLEGVPVVGDYVHLIVAGIFLLTSLHLSKADVAHYGIALGGLLEPPSDDRPRGPLGLWDLGRALYAALPSALRELGVAIGIAAVVFPIYTFGFWMWHEPTRAWSLVFPSELPSYLLAQVLVVALPEEAFFRGYVQTTLSDASQRRARVFGVEVAPMAWLVQAALFALLHVIVEPSPGRLAVFFPGLLFGWTRAWRKGIGAALALHAMSNLYSEILSRSWL